MLASYEDRRFALSMEWSSCSASENSCPELRTNPTNLLIGYPHCFLAVRGKVEECVYLHHHGELVSRLEPKTFLTRKGKEGAGQLIVFR